MDFVRGFVNQLSQSERANVITADGRLSQDGKRRIESAIAHQAYDDSSLVTRLAENLDELEAEEKQAQEDVLVTQIAISCALQFGE